MLSIKLFQASRRVSGKTKQDELSRGYGAQLHAKAFVVDGIMSVSGSLNYTVNSSGWMEMVTVTREPVAVQQHLDYFNRLWGMSHMVLDPEQVYTDLRTLRAKAETKRSASAGPSSRA